jgi:hypothetical protein
MTTFNHIDPSQSYKYPHLSAHHFLTDSHSHPTSSLHHPTQNNEDATTSPPKAQPSNDTKAVLGSLVATWDACIAVFFELWGGGLCAGIFAFFLPAFFPSIFFLLSFESEAMRAGEKKGRRMQG